MTARIIKRFFFIAHMEDFVFNNRPVSVGILSSKLLERKGFVWVDKAANISDICCYELITFMWIHLILKIHWSDISVKNNIMNSKKYIVCSFEKKAAGADIRMNHRDDECWTHIPHV